MIALLDANVLISLFDSAHVHHEKAQQWFGYHQHKGWATCPLTQNACIRVISQPSYPDRLSIAEITRRLRRAISTPNHRFWSDSISLCDSSLFAHDRIASPRQLTDLYLLALAVSQNGRLVTFDHHIPSLAVTAAKKSHLEFL
jgi:toxin-antitoxin system PIN domain toxin